MLSRPIPVLLYHRLSAEPTPDDRYCSRPALFRSHMKWLRDHDFRSLTLEEFERRVDGEPSPSGRPEVLITFDDGHRSQLEFAAPALREFGHTAASFIITDRVGDENTMAWDQIVGLDRDGTLTFGTHTHTHQRLPFGPQTADQMVAELAISKKLLAENLCRDSQSITHLAWPFGRTCDEWENKAQDLGLDTQFVVQRGAVTHTAQRHRLPRLITDDMSLPVFGMWMRALTRPATARAVNLVFGTIRQRCEGAGYR